MKKLLSGIVCLLVLLFLSGCTLSADKQKENIPFNPNIEAFTSGLVSRYVTPNVILMGEVSAEKLKDDSWKKSVRIEPETKGTFSLQEGRILSFRPQQALERDEEYTITVDLATLLDVTDETYKQFTASFHTKPFEVRAEFLSLDINPKNTANYDLVYLVQTSDRERPEDVESLIGASVKNKLLWQHQADGKRHLLTIKDVEADGNVITLSILKNKLGVPKEALCSTLLPDKNRFVVFETKYVREPEKFIEVTFTQALKKDQVLQGLAYISDNKSNLVTIDQNKLRLYPDQSQYGMLNIVLKKELTSMQGQTLSEDKNISIAEDEGLPAIRFVGEGVIVPETDHMKVPFQSIGLRGVIVRILKIAEQNVGVFLQTNQLDESSELLRVGKLMARKVIFLDEKNYDLSHWNTFALDLKEMIEPEPGAIYRIILSFDQSLSACDCPDVEKKSKEQLLADNELAYQSELTQFDGQCWYYQVDDIDWGLYNYKERLDPCKPTYYYNKSVGKNILASNIGLMAMSGTDGKMTVLAHSLQDAKPMSSVTVEAYNFQRQLLTSGSTDGDGQVVLNLPQTNGRPYYLLAKDGKQRSYLKVNYNSALSMSSFDVEGEVVQKGIKGFIYGERGVWRPGDTIHVGFMLFDRDKLLPERHPVKLSLVNPLGQVYQQKVSTKGSNGLYVFHVPTEASVPTGAWNACVEVGGVSFEKKIRIETIKPNRLKINLDVPKCLVRNKQTDIPLKVEWLQGATARNLKYDIKGTFIPAQTVFKGYEKYKFDDIATKFNSEESQLITGRTDEYGNAIVNTRLNLGTTAPGMLLGNFTTKVYEESGDFSIDVARLYYSPYETYVGIQSPQKGEEALTTDKSHRFNFACVDYLGQPLSGHPFDVYIYKLDWHWWWSSDLSNLANYASSTYYKPVIEKHFESNGEGRVYYDFTVEEDDWGVYLISAKDRISGHTSGMLAYFDWPGYQRSRDLNSLDEASVLNIKIDKEVYKPGEVIRLHTPSNKNSRAVVSVLTGSKVVMVKEFNCDANGTDLEIPVTKEMQPNAYLHVTLLQPYGLTADHILVRMFGVKPFTVNSEESHLYPQIETAQEWKPETKCEVNVSEQTGREMSYSLAVVDEGLLDLTRFRTPDPWKLFFAKEALGVNVWDLYNYVLGAYGGRIEELFSIGGDDALNKGPKAVVNRFAPIVKFTGPFHLKKGERKKHVLDIPNYNGRVRVMVVATDGAAYGNTEKSVLVRKPVMVLGTFPRVVGTGEEIVIPATVFATENGVGEVNVAIKCPEGVEIIGQSEKKIHFTKKDDKTVYFKIRVKEDMSKAKISIMGTGKGETSVYADHLAVRSVKTKQVKMLQAVIKPGETWKGKVDFKGMNGTNRLSLDVSAIQPLNISSRLKELEAYPHACLEQIVSQAFPQLYLNDLMDLSSEQIQKSERIVKKTINRLRSYQTGSGAFSYWPGLSNTNGWGSVYALHFLLMAEGKGYAVPASMKVNALNDIRRSASGWKLLANYYNEASEKLTQAYRLYVLALAGKADIGAMNRLRVQQLSAEAKWMLASAYAQIGRQDVAGSLMKNTNETQTTMVSAYDGTFGSNLRNQAIRLQALTLLNQEQEAALLVKNLSDTLGSEEWLNTQETAYSLVTLAAYYHKHGAKADGMNFSYQFADMQERIQTNKSVWANTLLENSEKSSSELVLKNEGKNVLYVQAETYGEVLQDKVEAASNMLNLSVSYQSSEGRPVSVASLEKGTNFTAQVLIQNPTAMPLRNLVLTEIFPSGWEILNTRFVPVVNSLQNGNISYQNIRDDRVYSYIDYLAPGSHILVQVNLCSVYQGRFYLPSIVCEAMYNKKVQANTASDIVVVK